MVAARMRLARGISVFLGPALIVATVAPATALPAALTVDHAAEAPAPDTAPLDLVTDLPIDPGRFGAEGAGGDATTTADEPSGVDDAVTARVEADGSAAVIVRLREQADLPALAEQARAAGHAAAAQARARLGGPSLQQRAAVADAARAAQGTVVVDELRRTAEASQTDVRELLDTHRAQGHVDAVTPFWIFNGFAATVDAAALRDLAAHPDVASITLDEVIELPEPIEADAGAPLLPTWSLEAVNAPDAWGEYGARGQGVVVGIMDSGADGGHPALAGSWRGAQGDPATSWYVPTGENYPTPGDGGGHGTHVTGSIVGAAPGQLTGVAPGATWIGAKIFRDSGSTTTSIIHDGFQWMLAPGGDPAAAPDVVNNSWGADTPNDTRFWDDVSAWVAAGIVPIFANGNSGPVPGSVGSPASAPQSIGIGATDSDDVIAFFSSRGPVYWDGVRHRKPQVSAPGHRILSTWPRQLDADGYHTISGTSMAAPHATGVVALMLSADPSLSVDQVRAVLEETARSEPHMAAVPNDVYGAGIVDAYSAVTRVAHSGTVSGTVTGPGGPVAAEVSIGDGSVTADAGTGRFEISVPEGTHTATVRAYGYTTVDRAVDVVAGEVNTLDVSLDAAEEFELTGTVSGPDGPVAGARLAFSGTPLEPARTGGDGTYAATIAAGSHAIRVSAAGHEPRTVDVVIDGPTTLDVELEALTQPSDPGWAQYQNNASRSGLSGDRIAAATLAESWTADAGSDVVFTSPVISDGRVLLGSDAGRLVARDIDTGEQQWDFRTGRALRGVPAVAGGLVYTGGGLDGGIHALDADTGEPRWSVPTPERLTVYTAPSVVDGVVYAATGPTDGRDDTVFALDAVTGEQIWTADVGPTVFAGPAVGEGLAIVGNAGDGELIALDAATGQRRWTLTRTDDYFIGGASIVEGTVYIATTDGDMGGSLLAVDAATGSLLWEAGTHGDGQGGTPAVYGDLVIAGSHGLGLVAAYDRASGAPAWHHGVEGVVSASVMVTDDGYVIGGSQLDRRVWALDAATGQEVWDAPTGANVTSSAAYADGRLVTADADGGIYAFTPTGSVAGTVSGPGGPVGATVRIVETGAEVQTDPATGTFDLAHRPGTFTLEVSSYGLATHTATVEIVAGETLDSDVALAAVGTGTLVGVVRDADGRALPGATVGLAGTPLDPVTTDAEGGFRFSGVAAGRYRLEVELTGYEPLAQPVDVVADETANVDLTLTRYEIALVGDDQGRMLAVLQGLGYAVQSTDYADVATRAGDFGVVVANGARDTDPGAETFRAFLAATDAAGTSVVWLDHWSLGWGSINHLINHVGDPAAAPGDYASDGRLSIVPTVNHPLTQGFPVGERTEFLAPNSGWSTFEGYSGRTVATLHTDEFGATGDLLAYAPRGTENVHVLVGSMAAAASWGNPEEDWLPAARTILSNSVSYAMDARFGVVTGAVTDEAGGPLAATVTAMGSGERTKAAPDGSYRLLLDPGEHTLRFSSVGSTAVERTVTVEAGTTTTVDVALAASGAGALSGVVTSGRDGSPITGAEVTLTGTDYAATTAADGSYQIPDLPAGSYDLVVAAAGHISDTRQIDVLLGAETLVDVELAAAPRVGVIGDYTADGIVALLNSAEFAAEPIGWTDAARLPDFDVVVFNNPTDPGGDAFRAFLDAMDAAQVSGIFPDDRFTSRGGARLLRTHLGDPAGSTPITGEGIVSYAPRQADHPLFAGLPAQPEILLADRYASAVVGYSGTPLADAVSEAGGNRGVGAAYLPRTPGSIHLLLAGLSAHSIQSPQSDWTEHGRALYLNAVRWATAPGLGTVEGTVLGPAGLPVPATVEAVATGDQERSVDVDGDGGYVLPLGPGTYTLRFSAFGYQTVEHTVDVARNTVTRLDVELVPGDGGSVFGTVTAGVEVGGIGALADGDPLAGATVTLLGTPLSTTTGADGGYRFALVEPGSYELEVVADGHRRIRVPITVTPGEATRTDIVLQVSPPVGVIDDYQGRLTSYLRYWGYAPEVIGWADTGRVGDLDLVVANMASNSGFDPGASGLAAFTDALNRAGVPAVWLDQFGRGSFRYLSGYGGDPGLVGAGRLDGDVTVTAADPGHPLLDGLPDTFPLVATDDEYSWFDEFSGTTVATVSTEDETARGLAGVRPRGAGAVDVLLGTLSLSFYGYPGDAGEPARSWTPEAERLLRNALSYALDADGLGAEIRGNLTDAADGSALTGEVRVAETGAVAPARAGDGSFVVPLPPGTWTLQASSFGFVTAEIAVDVEAGQVLTRPIQLTAQPSGSLTGTVTGPDGAPVAGADVAVVGTPLAATTGADGGYALGPLPVGAWVLRVTAPGFQVAEQPIAVTVDGETLRVDVELATSRPVAVVQDSGGSVAGLLAAEGYAVESFSASQLTTVAERVGDFELVVFNGAISSTYRDAFGRAVDAAAAAGVSTVFGGQYGGYAIGALSAVRGDPADYAYGFVPEAIELVPSGQHPIFAGFPAGEPVTIVANPGGNQQWLSYSGYSGTTLANVRSHTAGTDLGDAVGYRFSSPSSVEVLLGSLGAGTYGRPDTTWTADARRIYLNAVAWAIEARQAELAGVVTGAGRPVEGATVTAVEAGATATTAADGSYALGLSGGSHTVRVAAFGFEPVEHVVEVPESGTVTLDVDLTPSPRGVVTGTITATDGDPVDGADITATGPQAWTATADGSGAYSSGDLVAGEYHVTVTAPGHMPGEADVTVTGGAVSTLDVTLQPLDVGVLGDVGDAMVSHLRGAGVAAAGLEWDPDLDVEPYDVLVVNGGSPDRDTFDAVLTAADAAEASVVFTGTWGVDQGGVRLLERHTGRVSVGEQGYGEGPVTLTGFDPGHALFTGLTDPATLIVDGGYYSTLAAYDGRPLGRLSVSQDSGDPVTGLSAGYAWRTAGSIEVVLSASAVTGAVGPGLGWTDDAERLLLNAVEWGRSAAMPVPAAPVVEVPAPVTIAETTLVSGTADWPARVGVFVGDLELATADTALDGTWSAEVPLEVGANQLTAVATNLAGRSAPSAPVTVTRWSPEWKVIGGEFTRTVVLWLHGSEPGVEPADSAVLVVRDAEGSEVARRDMRWTEESSYLHVLKHLPDGDYSLSAEIDIGDTRIVIDGPPLTVS